jgi:hypothetical protein
MPASGVGRREAAAVLMDWREVESAIEVIRSSSVTGQAQIAELADLHAEARRLRVEYAEIIRRATTPGKIAGDV